MTMEAIENGVDFPMSCYFSGMVMISDNDDDDHVTMFIVMESVLEFGVCIFFSKSEFRPGNKTSSSMPTATLRGFE